MPATMYFVSVTRLQLRHWRLVPAFAWYATRSVHQSRRSPDNRHTQTFHDFGLVFWTITVWEAEAARRYFRNNHAHKAALPKLAAWCDEATYLHWQQPHETPPSVAVAAERLIREGIVSHVKHPAPRHATRAFPLPVKLR